MNFVFPIILGMSSSQLTFSPSFFRGVGFFHQPVMDLYLNRPDFTLIFDTLGSLCVSFAGEWRYPQLGQWQNKGQGRNHPEARQLLQPKRNLQPGRAPSGNCWCTATSSRSAQKSTCPQWSRKRADVIQACRIQACRPCCEFSAECYNSFTKTVRFKIEHFTDLA